ncbi:MAG TPA: 16S rRNA (cytosine(967)-C(5))-methyltransferase RsmB [Candidatus Saccharimonadales bacterium]|jgi:16S rRNA (cytosine967-C5)-methyltransferase|nr:16S rRNA (cytosine(967)-C(5))-methyltransferase RsmB [Candidatus Saccharimonadales bacterium]
MPVSPARSAAFQILMRVERDSAYADELLHSTLLERLSQPDCNLTTEIVMGVLRWRPALDSAFTGLLSTPVAKLDLAVLTALRMGTYQMAFLDRVPRHAIVDESVELVKQARKRSAAGMVNAVLRKLPPGRAGLPLEDEDPVIACAHPAWLVARWIAQFGRETAVKICRFDQQTPATKLRCRDDAARRLLHTEGIECVPGALLSNALTVTAGDVTRSSLFGSGQIAIQDEGSQLVAALAGQGNHILDCCAAPGGKTAAMADSLPGARIVAVEIHPHRARLLRKMAPQANIQVITADALQLPFGAEFDCVLADVPCSGSGTLARNPEIKWRLTPADLIDLQSRQIAILKAAMKHVAPGGRLVYSTCSLEPEENEQVVEACLQANPDFTMVPMAEELAKLRDAGTLVSMNLNGLISGSYFRTLPGVHPCDGFFAAVMARR